MRAKGFVLLVFLFTSLLVLPKVYAESPRSDWHCITDHLAEAMALNEQRKALYSSLSNGNSEAVSDALIGAEQALYKSLGYARPLLQHYWSNEVPVLCKEFVPMNQAPAFSEIFSTPIPEGSVRYVNPKILYAKLQGLMLFRGRSALIQAGRDEIAKLDKPDHFQCMMKHVLESLVKAAEVADEINQISGRKGLGSSYWLSDLSIQGQMALIPTASELDKKSEALHRQGIPIICNDVPQILNDL